jgi:CagE, TrbE, VirB family, component of type IV transporter system
MALQELGSDEISQAYVTASVTVWDEDAGTANEKLRLVEKIIEGRDFTCIPETVNAIEAWLGSLPGHVYANVRQPPVSDTQPRPYDASLGGLGRAAARLSFRCAALVPCPDGRLDALPFFAPCRGCRPHIDHWADRCREKRAAGAHGPAVSPLCRRPNFWELYI